MTSVGRTYDSEEAVPVPAVSDVTLSVKPGELVAVMGPSGCGKSTLLTIAGGLQPPDTGWVEVAGSRLDELDEPELYEHRRRHVGFVFQDFNLVSMLTAAENVALPLELDGARSSDAREQALKALEAVGLAAEADRFPATLSGGQQQRVAIARAVCGSSQRLLLADEPTGALDTGTAETVLDILVGLVGRGCTGVVVTHDPQVARRAGRVIEMQDGRLLDGQLAAS